MMADIGLVVVLAVVKLRVSLSDVSSASCIFDKRSDVSLKVLEQGRRWNVSSSHPPCDRKSAGAISYLTYVIAPPPDFEDMEHRTETSCAGTIKSIIYWS
jgi:hypothetical protein